MKALCADCQTMSAQEIGELLRDLLYAFPMQELRVYLPGGWTAWSTTTR